MYNAHTSPVYGMPKIIRDAIYEAGSHVKLPLEAAGGSVLSLAALAVQDLFNVQLPPGPIVPLSLFFLTLATSGDRKSSGDKAVYQPIRDLEFSWKEAHKLACKKYDIDRELWEERRSFLKAEYRKKGAREEDAKALQLHLATLPTPPICPALLMMNTTPEALAESLNSSNPSVGLVANEAAIVMNGPAASQLPMLNSLWDGADYPVHRKNSESFTLRDCRLTINLQVQPGEFQKFLDGRGKYARSNGFFARCLFAYPQSLQGFRYLTSVDPVSFEYVPVFQAKVVEFLQAARKMRESGKHARTLLTFSTDARVLWTEFANDVEARQQPGGPFHQTRDAASKMAENAARLAAVFHLFDGTGDVIGVETLRSAIDLMEWYASEFVRLFDLDVAYPQEYRDAYALEQWMRRQYQITNRLCFSLTYLFQSGPNSIRKKGRLRPAIDVLQRMNILYQKPPTKGDRGTAYWLSFNFPSLPPPPAQAMFS